MEPIHPHIGTKENPECAGSASSLMEQGKEKFEQGKASEWLGQAKDKTAETMDTLRQGYSRLQEGGEYLRERAGEGAEQVTRLIRRNPTSALLISFFAGFLCRALKR